MKQLINKPTITAILKEKTCRLPSLFERATARQCV
jgi:hypothetical protein